MINFFDEKQINVIAKILQKGLVDIGVNCAALIDVSGRIVVKRVNADSKNIDQDIKTMAVLAAGNFCAVSAIAEIIGESEFSLVVHKGKNGNIYLNKVMTGFLLLTIFGKEPSVGVLRLKVTETITQIQKINYRPPTKGDTASDSFQTELPKLSLSGLKNNLGLRLVSVLRRKIQQRSSLRKMIKHRIQGYLAK